MGIIAAALSWMLWWKFKKKKGSIHYKSLYLEACWTIYHSNNSTQCNSIEKHLWQEALSCYETWWSWNWGYWKQICETRGPFLESPETFRTYFGLHNSLCIFKTKASRGTKPCIYFNFYSLYNIWKDRLHRISGSQFYKWLFGPGKFSGLSRNGPQDLNLDILTQIKWSDYWANCGFPCWC